MPIKTSKVLAICISNLFHPLLVLTYMLILSILINPYAFGVSQIGEGKTSLYLLSIFGSTVVLPAISILLMKNLDMIGSWDMKDRMDRIGPFLAAGMWYISLCYNFYQLPDMPVLVKSAFVGVTIALFFSFFLNLFSKISIHAVGMGALIGFILVSMLLSNYNSISIGEWTIHIYLVLFIIIFLAGIVGSARLILEDHLPNDLYGGYLVGMATQMIALQIVT